MGKRNSKTETCPACGQDIPEGKSCCLAQEEEALPVVARLVYGKHAEHSHTLKSKWVRIGRDEANQVFVDDNFASRYHAWVTFERGKFWLEDLGSTNGTLLNGKVIQKREFLASGDKIKIGETELTFLVLDKTG